MINTSDAYKAAIIGASRRTHIRVPLRVVSPDLGYGEAPVTGNGAVISKPEQLYDDTTETGTPYVTLEQNRWRLDGAVDLVPDDYDIDGEVGYVGADLSSANGFFSTAQEVTLEFSGVTILQAITLYFSDYEPDGVPEDFTVSIGSGGSVAASQTITGNSASKVEVAGFAVNSPDAITLSITKWSLPYRRARVMEIFPGFTREWDESDIVSMSIRMQASISSTAQPYGTATVTIDNSNRMFDPRDKGSMFRSLEERLSIPIQIGVELEDGTTEYVPAGVWYWHSNGWSSTNNWLGMLWKMVDIIGLLSGRTFIVPASLPTTLEGWIAALVAQLGTNFAGRYSVDSDYASLSMTCAADDVDGKSCSEILRLLCQASGTFARMDAETGYLAVEPLWEQGNEYTLGNLGSLPTLLANDKMGILVFKLPDGTEELLGTDTSVTANTMTISNPFIADAAAAAEVAKNTLIAYGGNKISTTGRGDPSSEVGDVATVELMESDATVGRITMQTFDYSNGVLQNCKTEYLQADGIYRYKTREIITRNKTWIVPDGVSEIFVVIVGGGQAGGHGQRGTTSSERKEGWVSGGTGTQGVDGAGGSVYASTMTVSEGQTFAITIGAGGTAVTGSTGSTDAVDGEPTTFGAYSSEMGTVFRPSYTDIASGNSYGRTGIKSPIANRGDGGKGGDGGSPGSVKYKKTYDIHGNWTGGYTTIDSKSAGYGSGGSSGASGCVIIYHDKPAKTEMAEIITESGTWTVPSGVTAIDIILVGGGQGGGHGTSGSNPSAKRQGWVYGSSGSTGDSGSGGNIWQGAILVNPGDTFTVTIGAGGAAGSSRTATNGGDTKFGSYSSANGQTYSPSFTDTASGLVYGRSGVSVPAANSGDGGKGGSGGSGGAVYYLDLGSDIAGTHDYVATESYSATSGSYGVAGASGCVIIYYER